MGNGLYYYTLFDYDCRFAAVYRGEREENCCSKNLINFMVDEVWVRDNNIKIHQINGESFVKDIITICKSNYVDSGLSLIVRIIKGKGIVVSEDMVIDLESVPSMIIEGNKIDRYYYDNNKGNWDLKINDEIIPVKMDNVMKIKIKRRIVDNIREVFHY